MKTLFVPMTLFVLASAAIADVPKKIPRTRYSSLWTNSPFTSKPPPGEIAAVENPLTDFTLLGVSSLGEDKYRVTVVNKKTPDAERIYIDSDNPRPPDNFKIVKVTRTPGDPMGTTVMLSSGSMTGTIAYDEKSLTIATPKATPPQPGQPPQAGQPPTQPPNLPISGNSQGRPRPRVIPPPAPPAAAGAAAGPAPQFNRAMLQPNHQGSPQGQNNERPSRHRNY